MSLPKSRVLAPSALACLILLAPSPSLAAPSANTAAAGAKAQPAPGAMAQPGQPAAQPAQPTATPADACPPDAYCEEAEVVPQPAQAPASAGTAGEGTASAGIEGDDGSRTITLPPPPANSDPSRPRIVVIEPARGDRPEQITIYEDGAAPPHLPEYEAPPEFPPPPVHRRMHRGNKHGWRRHGITARVEGALMSSRGEHHGDAGMGGLGLTYRYRPVPAFSLDFAADYLGGVDSNGFHRRELPLSAGGTLYVNPRDVFQFYVLGGAHLSFASVESPEPVPNLREAGLRDDYTYLGVHAGLGVELRVTRLLGVHVDALGFARSRIDSDEGGLFPEYFDERTGEISNSSGAGLLRAGVTFWW